MMRDFLEENMLWIGLIGSFIVAVLVLHGKLENIGNAVNTLAALVAVVAVYYQGHLTRLTHGIDVLRSYDDRFDSQEYRGIRKRLARDLLSLPGGLSKLNDQADDVLNFLTTMGLLARRKIIDTEMVWALFLYWIHGYWQVAKESIERSRQADPTVYEDFVWLHSVVTQIEKQKRRCTDAEIEPSDPIEFLKEERDLEQVLDGTRAV